MMNVLDRLKQSGVVPVVVLDNAKDAAPTAKALLAGSVDVMEITFRTAAGNYVAVLTANGLDLYKQDMTRTARLDATQSATAVVMRMDGTALLLSGGTGRKFIP